MRRHYGLLSLAGMTCFLSMYTVQATPQPRIALVIGRMQRISGHPSIPQ
jgi:hypothetical protein